MDIDGSGKIMMKIIEFIQQNKNWKELLSFSPYNLSIKEKGNLILFNYSHIDSQINEITKEARGLILEKDTWKIIRYGFNRFFNFGEEYADIIDWNSANASSKEDGTLILLYYYNGWHVSTRSTFDAIEAPLNDSVYKNYQELFDSISENYHFNIDTLNHNYTYCFELCSCHNRIVISYPEPKLFHLLTRDNITLEEIEEDIGIPKPARYIINNGKAGAYDYITIVNMLDDTHEGIVVKDKFNNRVKIKTTEYVRLHYLMGLMAPTIENIVYLIWKNETSEFLQYFPEKKSIIDNVTEQLVAAEQKIEQIRAFVQGRPNWSTQDIYIWAKEYDHDYVDLYTTAARGRLDHYIISMKNSNRKIMDRTREVKPKVEELMKTQEWETADDAYNWALKHDSKNARAYYEIFNNNFNDYMKKLERAGATKFIEKFNIHFPE